MSILFFTNKARDLGGQALSATTTNARDTNYASEEIIFTAVNGTNASIFTNGTPTNIWFHCRVHTPFTINNNSNADGYWLNFFDQAGNSIAFIDLSDGDHRAYVDGSGTGSGSWFNLSNDTTYTLDLHCEITSTDIVLSIYVNKVLASTATVAKGTATSISEFQFNHTDMSQDNEEDIWYSEIILADEDTRGMRLALLEPDSNGGVQQWTGNYQDILDVDSATITSDTAAEISTFGLGAYNGDASPASIRAVAVKTRGYTGDTGPQNTKHILRISSTNYEGAQFSPAGEVNVTLWDDNPATAGAWTVSDLVFLEAGVKSET